mgnify:CR=1 FL=1
MEIKHSVVILTKNKPHHWYFISELAKVSDVKAGGNKIINLLETAITILFLLVIIEVFLQRKNIFDFN